MRKKDISCKVKEDSIKDGDNSEAKKKLSKELLIIAQEVKIVKALACNDLKKRTRQVRKLRKWFQVRSCSSFPFSQEDFMRIWKGLYYNMWMSDKPLVQEELAEQLAQLLDSFNGNVQYSVEFFGAFMRTMHQEWFGIDQWRMDKFLMLVRRMLRLMLRILKRSAWYGDFVQSFNKQMQDSILSDNTTARGLTMHFMDIFFEELAKVSDGDISANQVNLFLLPFITYIGTQHDAKLVAQCRTRVLYHLLYQSTLGREYSDKYNAWKEMGFATASIDDLEKIDNITDAETQINRNIEQNDVFNNLDPRAGNVDIYMPVLPIDPDCVISEITTLLHTNEYNSKRRKALKKLLHVFETFKNGKFPLGVKTMPCNSLEPFNEVITDKIDKLENLENTLYGTGRKLKQLNKRRRRKLLSTINFDNIDENNYDDELAKALPKTHFLSKRIQKTQISILKGWKEEKLRNDDCEYTKDLKDAKRTGRNNNASEPETTIKLVNQNPQVLGWDHPLADGEVEYIIPSRKVKLNKANSEFLQKGTVGLPKPFMQQEKSKKRQAEPTVSSPNKRVKIALKHNTSQNASDYIKQIKSSPQLPYDASKKPGKGLLKPNSIPSPINPFYKKKIGLILSNDGF